MWSQARLAVYITGALGAAATLLALFGWATFDKETWLLDIHPFDVRLLATQISVFLAPPLAWLALKLGWRK
jgi:hypothetical protein